MSSTEVQPAYQEVPSLVPANVGPYTGVQFDRIRKYENGRSLRIITYQAFNAMGLIGSEYNGVAVLDEDSLQVVTDQLARAPSGYNGVSREAWDLAWKLVTGTWDEVKEIVNESSQCRRPLA